MKNDDKNIEFNSVESSYLMYLDANHLFGWRISQNVPVNGFKWVKKLSKFGECFIKDYDENSNKGYFFEVDVKYPKNVFNLHSDLPFLPERNKTKECNKLICNVHDKENYVVHIRALKQPLNHGLILKKLREGIQFNQEAWLKRYIDMNTKLRTEAENDFEKDF